MPGLLRIRNARVWTGDPSQPWLDSLAIRGDRVVPTRDAEQHGSGTGARVIDAQQCVVVPGLIDSHMHLLMGGKSLSEVDLSGVRSREEFERAIVDADARLAPDQWLIGRGWSERNWPGHEMPDKRWLLTSGGRPCVCHRMDIHAAVVNEPVLRMIDAANRVDPTGGRIVRDSKSGEPTGLLLEAAAWELVNPLIPDLSVEGKRECLRDATKHSNALGLTAVGSMEFASEVEDVFVPMRDELTLRCAITLLDRAVRDEPFDFRFGQTFSSDSRLSVIGYKTFIDGTLGSRTARFLESYSDDGAAGNRGMLVELAAAGRLNEWARAVAATGLSPSMHAIGDEAVRLGLAAIDSVPIDARTTVRPRIEHAQHIASADLQRWPPGQIASMQPLHKADDGRYIEQRLGRERVRGAFAFRALLHAGARLAFGSDWPVVSCDPMLGMRAAITGLTLDDKPFGLDQNLTVDQALRAYTADAAYCLRLDHCGGAGVLREDMLGDCVMLDVDPFTADWVRRPPRVMTTIVGGEVVFDASQ